MALKIQYHPHNLLLLNSLPSTFSLSPSSLSVPTTSNNSNSYLCFKFPKNSTNLRRRSKNGRTSASAGVGVISAALQPLDLTEDNVRLALEDARTEFAQIFDTSVGMTGVAELAEVDGPFVKIRLRGRFWHERSLVMARLGNYLKQRIPEILEVDIEDEKQLDDSPANF
ncbi:Multidrug efflux pump subunit acrb like [Thalictrum thalictroides]|uniref:Multidrug efflux pump subunit acrb like n=1 Tax=Thalictrum thalictroides TaxID=46969 RepID=A0A7J6WVU8_THATH|nr:Multidrug efflux pump subunit acrb like [Thalictrum thalictroides]